MTEIRSWYQTEAARWRARLGTPEETRSTEALELLSKQVDRASLEYERDYGRPYTDGERRVIAQGLELRGRAAAQFASPELSREDLDRLGIGYSVPAERPDRGIAVLVDGRWTGDPEIVTRMTDACNAIPPAVRQEMTRRIEAVEKATRGVPGV